MDKLIEQVLIGRRDAMKVPESIDMAVLSAAKNGPGPGLSFAVRSGFSLLAVFTVGIGLSAALMGPRKALERDCRRTLAEMVDAVETRDVGRSLAFYSIEGTEPGRLEENIRTFYGRYDSISYEITSVRIRTAKDAALAETTYALTAVKGKETVRYTGTDRIYMAREGGRLKIRHWLEG